MSLKEKLLNSGKIVGVWGCGYIGFSSMSYFALNGVKCLAVDVDETKVEYINKGNLPIPNMEYWLGFDTKPLVRAGMMRATTNWRELISKDVVVHLVCIPTEKGAMPYDDILKDVVGKLTALKDVKMDEPPLIIIESTLTPGRTGEVVMPVLKQGGLKVGKDILVGVAPRRDWFVSPEKSLKVLPRVVGGTTPETTEAMKEVLSIVCDSILPTYDHRHAELVKSIENAYRHMDITLANQLSLAYPDVDMREVLRLVGTKWNIQRYFQSFGTAGYCIPLSSQYVLLGAKDKGALTLLIETIKTDRDMPYLVAQSLIKRGAKNVGILGLAYKGDLKVHVLSSTIAITEHLKSKGVEVKVHDPYYSEQEIQQILGVETFKYPSGLNEFDTVLVVSDHREYQSTPHQILLENLKKCKFILNNTEIWEDIDFKKVGIEHKIAGTEGWL